MSFELKRDEIYQTFFMPNGQQLVVGLRWPEPHEFRHLFYKMDLQMKPVGRNKMQIKARDRSHLQPFFIDHLTAVATTKGNGLKGTLEQHRAFFEKNAHLGAPDTVILRCLLNTRVIYPEADEQLSDSLDDMLRGSIRIGVQEWDQDERKVVERVLEHELETPNAQQRMQYEAATRVTRDIRKGDIEQGEDPMAVTNLYKARIRRIEGATVEGLPCEADIREDWLDLVPYHWISTVMAEDARGVEAENFT